MVISISLPLPANTRGDEAGYRRGAAAQFTVAAGGKPEVVAALFKSFIGRKGLAKLLLVREERTDADNPCKRKDYSFFAFTLNRIVSFGSCLSALLKLRSSDTMSGLSFAASATIS